MKLDVDEVIQCAAQLVDTPGFDDRADRDDQFRAGVVALATALCFPVVTPDALTVMGYAVYGVNRPGGA